MKKKMIRKRLDTITSLVETKLIWAIHNLQQLKFQYENEYTNIEIEIETIQEGSYSSHTVIYLVGERLETEDEYDARMINKKKHQEIIDRMELAEYERLKAKFEGN